jgi:hypothetical protein
MIPVHFTVQYAVKCQTADFAVFACFVFYGLTVYSDVRTSHLASVMSDSSPLT